MANFDYVYRYDYSPYTSYYLRLTVTERANSVSVSNNTSIVDWSAKIIKTYGTGRWSDNYCPYSVSINGSIVAEGSTRYNFENYTELELASGNTTITHDSNGAKTIACSFWFNGYNSPSLGSGTASGNLELTTIPRASSLSIPSSASTNSTTIAATISRADASFTHKLLWSYSSYSNQEWASFNASTTSLNLSVPTNVRTKMKANNASSATMALVLQTFNGSSLIGSTNYSITVSAPTATVSVSPSSVACNSATTSITLGNIDTSACTYKYERIYNNSVIYTYPSSGTTTTTSLSSQSNASFESNILSSTKGTITVKVTTYVGSTVVGSKTADYTVTIPTGTYKPGITLSTAASRTGTAYGSIAYLAGYNGATMKFTESVTGSAQIVSREIIMSRGSCTSSKSNSVTTVTTGTFPADSANYTVTVTMKVTDSRGTSASASTSISVSGYSLPVFNSATALRATSSGTVDGEGKYANISATATAHSNAGSISTIALYYGTSTSITGTTTSASGRSRTTYKNGYVYGSEFPITSEYTFTAKATDALGLSSSISFILPKASVTLSLHKSGGLGIGTTAEAGHITTPWPIITTRTDVLHYRNTYGAFNFLFTKDGPDQYGIGVGLGAGGTTVVGGGESASAALNEANASHENLWLTADNVIYICTNANTWSSRKTITVNTSGQITGGTGGSWISGRANALVVNNSNSSGNTGSFYPVVTTKSATGAWSIGTLGDSLYFSFTTDSNYSAGSNTASSYYISTGGWFSGTANKADSATNATNATNVGVTNKNVSTGEWFYVPWINNLTTENQAIWANNGFRYYTLEGTASAAGHAIIQLGNSTATGTAGNKTGRIRLYSSSSGYIDVYATASSANRTIYIPAIPANADFATTTTLMSGTKLKGGSTKSLTMSGYRRLRIYALTWGYQHVFEMDISDANGQAVADEGLYDSSYPYQTGSMIAVRDGAGNTGAITFYQVMCKVNSAKTTFWVNAMGYTRPGNSTYNDRNNYDQYYVYRVEGLM